MKAERKRAVKNPMVGRFVIIETDGTSNPNRLSGETETKGPFGTMEQVERWMVNDAISTYGNGEEECRAGDDIEWGSETYICEIKRVVKQVPNVRITARIADVPGREKR